MGYDHSMNAEIEFKSDVSIDTALAALQPLSDYCGWEREDLMRNKLSGDDSVEITVEEGAILHMSIYTCGEVSHSYPDLIRDFANQLRDIAEAGSIELRDHDTGDLENAILTIWYGDLDEVVAAQRIHAWQEAAALLQGVGTSQEVLRAMATIGGFNT